MTREQKLALIMGFALVLVVGVLVSDHLSRAGREDALSTDGLDSRLTLREDTGASRLLVNTDLADAPNPIAATPETRFAQDSSNTTLGGFFDRVGDGIRENSPRIGDLPVTVNTTNGRRDGDTGEGGVKELEMGRSVPTAHRPEAARLYRVKPNDSLWGIAQREYDDGNLHTKLRVYNSDRVGKDGGLREGATILIPDKDVLLSYKEGDERIVERGSAPGRTTPEPAQTPEAPKARTYVVKKGETLSEICQDRLGAGSRWREVVELNDGDIPDNGTVRIGQEILLPAS